MVFFCVCFVALNGIVAWDSLKILFIGYVKLSNDVIQKILDGSPVLEILKLYYFYGDTNRLRVSNASDKNLLMKQFWSASGTHRDVSKVQSLEILGCLRR